MSDWMVGAYRGGASASTVGPPQQIPSGARKTADPMPPACVFCKIVAGEAPAEIVCRWDDAVAFRPLDPVTNGHTLVVPTQHVANYTENAGITAAVMRRAAELAPMIDRESNLITSSGEKATQTVFHLHVHIVPRRTGDGLHLPWTPVL